MDTEIADRRMLLYDWSMFFIKNVSVYVCLLYSSLFVRIRISIIIFFNPRKYT